MQPQRNLGRAALVALVALSLALAGCRAKKDDNKNLTSDGGGAVTTDAGGSAPGGAKGTVDIKTPEFEGLLFSLGEGEEKRTRGPANKVATDAKPLDPNAIASVLARLPKVDAKPDDKKDFAVREGSKPPPRTGATVKGQFPPKQDAGAPPDKAAGPLEVLRFQPEGDVGLAPHLSVTFSQPMIAITTQDEASKTVPVRLTPTPEGQWRWVGTRTLLFEPEGRFPMATEYAATIPAGTKSKTGGELAQAVSFKFSTPPPKVQRQWPSSGPQRTDVPMFIGFDQRIDRAAILEHLQVKAGGKTHALALLTDKEIEAHEQLSRLVKDAEPDRWIAFRSSERFPTATGVTVTLGAGAPSAEGPLTTKSAQSFTFRTYAPLKVEEAKCGWRECRPFMPFNVRFNNQLNEEVFDASQVTVSPEIPGVKIHVGWRNLTVQGRTKGRTKYTVKIAPTLEDKFGQTLGEEEVLTFSVGSAEPNVSLLGGPLVTLDPFSPKKALSLFSINVPSVGLELRKVSPEDYPAYLKWMSDRWRKDNPPKLPGTRISKETVKLEGEQDDLTESQLDLSKAFEEGYGHVIVVVQPPGGLKAIFGDRPRPIVKWVQATQIGLDAFVDHGELIGWASALKTGAPLSDVELRLLPGTTSGKTGADGLAKIALPSAGGPHTSMLIAKKGKDSALLIDGGYWNNNPNWVKRTQGKRLAWHTFDDRGMYKPKETVRVKGWMRVLDMGEGGGIERADVQTIRYKVRGPRGNDLTTGEATVTALSGFDFSFELPDSVNLGQAYVELSGSGSSAGGTHYHYFQIQEFRRPEFEVSARVSEGPHFVGDSAVATVDAKYYSGGPLPNAQTTWNVNATPGSFTPPNRSDWIFGRWVPWWSHRYDSSNNSRHQSFEGKTDASGSHQLKIDLEGVNPPRAMSLSAEATVMDVNRQAWTARTTLLVHPAAHYVGLKTERRFVQRGEKIKVDGLVTDLDGEAIAGREIRMQSVRLEWTRKKGEWVEEEVDPKTCTVRSNSDDKGVRCEFATTEGGRHRIRATIADERGRTNQTEMTVWVAGGKRPPKRDVEQEEVELIPDKKTYQPGDTAEILVQAPFSPAEGVLTLRRSGIIETRRFTMKAPSTTLKVAIDAAHMPNLHVHVDLVGAAPRTNDKGEADPKLPNRPAFAQGSLTLSIPALERTLAVDLKPRDEALEPGGETTVDLVVKDAKGNPVKDAEVALVVVDEAILALSSYDLADPIATFYAARGADSRDAHNRQLIVLTAPDIIAEAANKDGAPMEQKALRTAGAAPGGGEGAPPPAPMAKMAREEAEADDAIGGLAQGGDAPIAVRKNFDPLAHFAPVVPTDAKGKAAVPIKLPDNLTRYRVMAVVVSGTDHFGHAESAVTARLPLMVRPSAPRFLNFGDKMELPVVLQNQTDGPLEVQVAVRVTNLELTAGAGRVVTVPANDRVEVRFPTAAQMAGVARIQIAATSGRWADAAEIELPVWTPATSEAFATYGSVPEGSGGAGKDGVMVQPVASPPDVWPQFGGLTVTTSSTQLQALTDAFVYLVSYPYECSEQVSSRILAIAALRDVLSAFDAEGLPKPKELVGYVDRDLDILKGMQNGDGGFPFWRRGHRSWPYLTVHITHAMARAKAKGFKVPERMLERAHKYLKEIERHFPSTYGPEIRRTITAYSLYVRNLLGDRDLTKANRIVREGGGVDKLGLELVGWLWPVFSGDEGSKQTVAKIRRHVGNRVTETAAGAHFASNYSDGAHLILHSNRRADGILLEAMLTDTPDSDLVVKVARGLLAHRKKGRWGNTQENAFVLLALDKYFHVYEKVTPNFVARVWLGDGFAGEHAFEGRTTERHAIEVPMRWLTDTDHKGEQNLVVQKKGKGRLYYRVGMKYAPKSLKLEPADHGFVVERAYEAIDDPADVQRRPDGTWIIKSGAEVRIRLTMVAPTRRYHVALVDPLPAGLEPLNPALAVTGSIPDDPKSSDKGAYWWWWRTWYEHQNMRDERVEAFTSLLWGGVHTYTYVARATTPGEFVVPPPKAEEMYHPETFGRGASAKVIVR